VIAINTAIGTFSMSRTERTLSRLLQLEGRAAVIRASRTIEIPVDEVVPGDLLILTPGTILAADARIIEADRLAVSEAVLTGESEPRAKRRAALRGKHIALALRANMAWRGTQVTGGSGKALAIAIGSNTEIGRIQRLVGDTSPPATPLQRQMEGLSRRLVFLSLLASAVIVIAGVWRGHGLLAMLKSAVSLAVAAIPEGLPTLTTTTLAIGVEEMRRRRVLVRHLQAIETLAAVQVICFDKTGTLTENRMRVTAIECAPGEERRLLETALLCSENGYPAASPTERALYEAALDRGVDASSLAARFPRLDVQYRAERRRFMTSFHSDANHGNGGHSNGRGALIAMKGSPDEVLERCDHYWREGKEELLSPSHRRTIAHANEHLGTRGLRVLGVASKRRLSHDHGELIGLSWIGLIAIADPARAGLEALMARFHRAGIRTVMITGDQSATARAVAQSIGLGNGETRVLDADEEDFAALAGSAQVFARVSPAQKLRIVEALQRAHGVVAMTGDGVNDGPALKAADVGVAMGSAGSDAAREIADIILEDDNLATMMEAIERG
ncbi:MAG TPA: cation-transporting P-type ATPase, partial [Stellaceae bacterium]|nr:cation-transporting P-type ATPase [Stellaceae bacterium]